MKMKLAWACAVAVPLMTVPAWGQEPAEAPKTLKVPGPPEAPRRNFVALRVQLVLSKYQGEKKISSLPYQFIVNSEDPRGALIRMGIEVPVMVAGGASTTYNWRNVGTSIDCSATSDREVGGRFKLQFSVEQSSLYSVSGEKGSGASGTRDVPVSSDAPLFRSFKANFSALMRDGESSQYTSVPDPVNGEVIKVDVTLGVVK